MKSALSVNRLAWRLLEKMLENSDLYGVKVETEKSGATIIDAGVETRGGLEAGRIITEICMGGCGKAEINMHKYGDLHLPSIFVYTDHPTIATLGSQYAGWQIGEEGYFAIGSGPGRALALKPKEICQEIGYKDDSDRAIVVLETDRRPPPKLIKHLVSDCKIVAKNLALILAPTTSIAGATQVSGRIVETGIHKLRRLGLDPNAIVYACGSAPIAPIHPKFVRAMARTNDAILYGGTAYYTVDYGNEEKLRRIMKKAHSGSSSNYGKLFIEIFKEAKYDFYKIDPDIFAPAVVVVNNAKNGTSLRSGKINSKLLAESFGV